MSSSESRSAEESLLSEEPNHYRLGDVKITPAAMLFENAYEGKRYRQTMTFQNCGKRLIFLRLTEPTSRMFEYKSFNDGIYLAPGMSISRTVRFTYSSTMVGRDAFANVYVNGKEGEYHFTVTLSAAILSIEPEILDFGQTDAVNHAITRTFFIINSGVKGTLFAVDLGRNPLDLLVEPLKGVIPAKSSVAISVEIIGSREGEFIEEIWIKTTPPQRITITGAFIAPKLLVRNFLDSLDFTLIEFPPTYYGATSTHYLLIKNFSSSHSMFCVMAEIKGTTMTLEEAREADENYRNFRVHPIDGRMAAHKGSLIEITFKPCISSVKNKCYAACFLKVIRMDCRDLTEEDQCKRIQVLSRFLDLYRYFTVNASQSSQVSLHAGLVAGPLQKDVQTKKGVSLMSFLMQDEDPFSDDSFSFEHSIGVCLHGEKEIANVSLRPDVICLSELTLNRVYQRELLITNNNPRLPIKVKYIKIPCFDVIPHQVDLKAGQSVEVALTIRTSRIDRVEKKVSFDLFARDYPEGKKTFRKIAKVSVAVTFETTVIHKKSRPDKCVVYKELPGKLESDYPYRLSETALAKKIQNDNYYLNYIRSLQTKPLKLLEETLEYAVTNPTPFKCCKSISRSERKGPYSTFIPLAPRLLHNIKIIPKCIKLRKVAEDTTITDFLTIENQNPFPIHVFATACKSSIVFGEPRHILEGSESKELYFTFSNSRIGRYYININILINNFALYEVTAVTHVVPKTLKLDSNIIEFTEKDGNYKFIKLRNRLNAYTSFDWDLPNGCFRIFPKEGGIKAESYMLCMVTYVPDVTEPNAVESCLTSESGQKRIVTISYRKRQHSVVFDAYEIDFGLIPLNVPISRKLTLRNLKTSQVLYCVPNGLPIPGIVIEPQAGVLDGLDSQVFVIKVNLKAVINFNAEIIFLIDDDEEIAIALRGTVDYPKFNFEPTTLYFRKISPFSYDTLAFKVTNQSRCESFVRFPAEEFPEFTVTEQAERQYPHLDEVTLLPGQSRVLFLHFHPNHISTYSFYLPYIINGILGPVRVNSSRTSSPLHFLQETNLYDKVQTAAVEIIPRSLPVARINCNATQKTLEFSQLHINFLYFGEGHYSNVTYADFEITNMKDDDAEVCIRIDNLEYPFSLTPKDDDNIEYHNVSYRFTIPPKEKFAFTAEFYPMDLGKYSAELPIFLNGYYDNHIFNNLTLEGVYGRPTIIPSTQRCDFEPIPTRFSNEIILTLRLYNHFDDCLVSVFSDLEGLSSWFTKDPSSTREKIVLEFTLRHDERHTSSFCSDVSFECSCGTCCQVTLTGVTENCLLTTHAFCNSLKRETRLMTKSMTFMGSRYEIPKYIDILVNKNVTSFPLFPKNDDESTYARYMRHVAKTLEDWLFCQVFYKKCYYRIPEGFSDYCKVYEPPRKLLFGGYKKPKIGDLPLLELIGNIAGRNIRRQLSPSFPKIFEGKEWLIYTHKVNSNVLKFLSNFPVHIPHVEAKFLLNYEQYRLFEKLKHPKIKPFEESVFYRLSKQCWIDLILQIIKAFFLFRTVQLTLTEEPSIPQIKYRFRRSVSVSVSRTNSDEEGENFLDIGVYGPHEKELMTWLQECFDEERRFLWSQPPKPKTLVFLDEDLRDGLMLGAAIGHYCPYVRNELEGLYTHPHNREEMHHNACVIVNTCKMLKFSYVIAPNTLLTGGMVAMLLFVNYLYDILPSCEPREEITIEASLTQTNSTVVELENVGTDEIIYKVVFFGNESGLFHVAKKRVIVEPRRTRLVRVRYHAKTVQTVTAALLFSGETPGAKYGRSVAVALTGVADVSYACMNIPITVDLYRPCKVTIATQSPFKVKARYTLYFGYHPPDKEKKYLFPWEEIKNIKTIKECYLQDAMCEFDEEGRCVTSELVCCRQIGPREMWLYYTNPEVGDWGMQLTLTGRVTEECFENIDVLLPEKYDKHACRCGDKPSLIMNCPMILRVKVPKMNNRLWQARKGMVLHYVQGQELNFWTKRIYSPIGTRILKLVLESETHPMRQLVDETVEYNIHLDRPVSFVTMHKVVIDDVISDGHFILPIHPTKDVLQVKSSVMKWVSADGEETRFYRLVFLPEGGKKVSLAETK